MLVSDCSGSDGSDGSGGGEKLSRRESSSFIYPEIPSSSSSPSAFPLLLLPPRTTEVIPTISQLSATTVSQLAERRQSSLVQWREAIETILYSPSSIHPPLIVSNMLGGILHARFMLACKLN